MLEHHCHVQRYIRDLCLIIPEICVTEQVSYFSTGIVKASCKGDTRELCCKRTDHGKGRMGEGDKQIIHVAFATENF